MERLLFQYEEDFVEHLKSIDFSIIRKDHEIKIDFEVPPDIDWDEFYDEVNDINNEIFDSLGVYCSIKPNGESEYWLSNECYDSAGRKITSDFNKRYDTNDMYYNGDNIGFDVMKRTLLDKCVGE